MVGLAVIGILIAAVTLVSRQFNEPEQAPLNFVEPSFSATATPSVVDADHDRDDHQHQPPGHHRHQRAVVHHLVLVGHVEQQ